MTHSLIELYLHLVFSTKDRLALIPDEMETRLYGYLRSIAKNQRSLVLAINGVSDHVHISLKLHQSVALSDLIRNMKSYSTGWLKKQGITNFEWQDGYSAYSCSITHLDALTTYIQNQKEHHKIVTFQEEFERMQKIWGIDPPMLN
jgi:putative transposase